MNVVMGCQDRSCSNPPTVQHNTSLLRYQYSIVLQECFTLLILVSLHTNVGILIKTFIKMQILTVKLIYQWYNKAVTELLNGQKSWLGSGILNFSLRGKHEWFIASKKNWLLETIIKKKYNWIIRPDLADLKTWMDPLEKTTIPKSGEHQVSETPFLNMFCKWHEDRDRWHNIVTRSSHS